MEVSEVCYRKLVGNIFWRKHVALLLTFITGNRGVRVRQWVNTYGSDADVSIVYAKYYLTKYPIISMR